MAQRVGRGIALLFHDRGTRRGWVVSNTPWLHLTPGKDPVPILQEAGWAPGSVWTGGKSRPHRDSILDRLACSQSLYRPSYPAHAITYVRVCICYYTITCYSLRMNCHFLFIYQMITWMTLNEHVPLTEWWGNVQLILRHKTLVTIWWIHELIDTGKEKDSVSSHNYSFYIKIQLNPLKA